MRVLHLWDNYAPGLFDRSFEICLAERIETRLACMNFIGRGHSLPEGAVAVRQLNDAHNGNGRVARMARKIRAKLDEWRFRKLVGSEIASFDPDVLHVHYGTTAARLVDELERSRKPFVISFYGFDISQGINIRAVRRAYQRLFRAQPLVHVLCDEARD